MDNRGRLDGQLDAPIAVSPIAMMSARRKTLARILECPICLEQFRTPKMLPTCQHSFCLTCLFRLYQESGNQNAIVCPMCKKAFYLKECRRVSIAHFAELLPNNLTMIELLDWQADQDPLVTTLLVSQDRCKSADVLNPPRAPLQRSAPPSPHWSPLVNNKHSPITVHDSCSECATEAQWNCISCDVRLCDSCLPEHLSHNSEHQTFNIADETTKMDIVRDSGGRGGNRRSNSKKLQGQNFLSVGTFVFERRRSAPDRSRSGGTG